MSNACAIGGPAQKVIPYANIFTTFFSIRFKVFDTFVVEFCAGVGNKN